MPLSGCKSQVNGVSRRLYAGSRGRSQSVRVSVFHSWIESKAAFGCESSARVLIGRSGSPTAIPARRGDGGSIRLYVYTDIIFCAETMTVQLFSFHFSSFLSFFRVCRLYKD